MVAVLALLNLQIGLVALGIHQPPRLMAVMAHQRLRDKVITQDQEVIPHLTMVVVAVVEHLLRAQTEQALLAVMVAMEPHLRFLE